MKFFTRKNSDSHSRRTTRMWLLRLRKCLIVTSLLAVIAAAGYAGAQTDSFKKYGEELTNESLSRTAAAGFKVKDILVTGRQQIPAEELLASLSVKRGMPLFSVSIASAERSLSSIPWVKNVRISRRLPDTIVVALDERKPVALWQYQRRISLIDAEGAVLTTENLDDWKHLPLVVGAGAEKHVATLVGMLAAEPAIAANLIAAVRVEDRRWDLRLTNNITVKLPENDMELALRRLAVLDQDNNLFARDIVAIDLRQPERMIVTPAAATTIKTNI